MEDQELPTVPSSSKKINMLVTPDIEGAEPRFLSRGINLLYGYESAGKTSLCLDLTFNAIEKNLKVMYIDTERGVDVWRIRQIMKARKLSLPIVTIPKGLKGYKIGSLVLIYESTLSGIRAMLKIIQSKKPDILIIDNIVSHYMALICSSSKGEAYGNASKEIIVISSQINAFCGQWNMSALFTSQPVSDIKRQEILELEKGVGKGAHDEVFFVGGKGLRFEPKLRVALKKKGGNKREMILEKHRSKAPGENCVFQITDKGVGDVV